VCSVTLCITTAVVPPRLALVCIAAQVQYKNVMFTVWDVGGQEKLRPLW
jgi:GTPase SAR1 family protein